MAIDGGLIQPDIFRKSQSNIISYSRTETGSQTVTKTKNVKLGGANINNVYLGTNKVKSIYLGDKLIIGTQTTYYDLSTKYTLSIEIDNDHSLSNEAKYDAYSYIVGNLHLTNRDDPVETTINTYMHNTYSYIRYLVTSGRTSTPSDLILASPASYSVSKGFAVKRTLGHVTGEYELVVYNSPFTPNNNLNGPIPFAQFSVYTDYQKLNCNVWKSFWYDAIEHPTEPPTDTPQNSTAQITLTSSINSTLKCVGVTLVLRPANTNKTISLLVTNGTITGNATVEFDNLTNGTTNTIQISNFKFANSTGNLLVPTGYGDLIAMVNGTSTTIDSGSLSSLSGSLSLDCPENGKNFIINISIRIQQTS